MANRSLLRWIGLAVGILVVVQRAVRWLRVGDAAETVIPLWVLATNWVPLLLLLVALVISWWRPLVGALAFLGYFLLYALVSLEQDFPYVGAAVFTTIFATPIGLVGTLLLAAWLQERHQNRARR